MSRFQNAPAGLRTKLSWSFVAAGVFGLVALLVLSGSQRQPADQNVADLAHRSWVELSSIGQVVAQADISQSEPDGRWLRTADAAVDRWKESHHELDRALKLLSMEHVEVAKLGSRLESRVAVYERSINQLLDGKLLDGSGPHKAADLLGMIDDQSKLAACYGEVINTSTALAIPDTSYQLLIICGVFAAVLFSIAAMLHVVNRTAAESHEDHAEIQRQREFQSAEIARMRNALTEVAKEIFTARRANEELKMMLAESGKHLPQVTAPPQIVRY